MRPLFAISLVALILGTVQGFMVLQQSIAEQHADRWEHDREASATADFHCQLDVTLNFPAASDPFLLYPASLEIMRVGATEPVVRHVAPIGAHETVAVEVNSGVLREGLNELTVQVWPADSSELASQHTLTLRWQIDGEPQPEQVWRGSVQGESVVAHGRFELPEQNARKELAR